MIVFLNILLTVQLFSILLTIHLGNALIYCADETIIYNSGFIRLLLNNIDFIKYLITIVLINDSRTYFLNRVDDRELYLFKK